MEIVYIYFSGALLRGQGTLNVLLSYWIEALLWQCHLHPYLALSYIDE